MKVILFGATGMVGQGVLRECVLDDSVERVLVVGRNSLENSDKTSPKVHELLIKDLYDYSKVESDLEGYDACLFCLGISSAGMNEKDYRHITYDLTLAAAKTLVKLSPGLRFLYVSGASTDANGKAMWARVKGETENALLALGFKSAVMCRPGYIQPLHGIRSRTTVYRALYAVMAPLYPLWKLLFPKVVTTTEKLGRAMLIVAKEGSDKPILETVDLNEIAEKYGKSALRPAS